MPSKVTPTGTLLETDTRPDRRVPYPGTAKVIKAETNLLRFPFFALGRRGLKNRKGIVVRGKTTINNHATDFEYRVTCNSDDPYPGPLARNCHFALLDILHAKQEIPFANPIEFTWRELMAHIGMSPGGEGVRQLKQAIRSIEGTRVRTTFALKNANDSFLKSREHGYGLYSQYVFVDEHLPDATTIANKNFVWLSDWYLTNLNSLYCSPLDYPLWLALNQFSTIASRLYEFLIYNFAGDWQTQTINYEKLASFLPVVPKIHPSQIKQQLGAALTLLIQHGVLADHRIAKGKRGQPLLVFARGPALQKATASQRFHHHPPLESTEIQDPYKSTTPEAELIDEFYQLWTGQKTSRPTARARAQARQLLDQHPHNTALAILPFAVKVLKQRFSEAKTFGALLRYWPEGERLYEKTKRAADRKKDEFLRGQLEEDHQQQGKADRARLQDVWRSMSEAEQQEIRSEVLKQHSPSMKLGKRPELLERFCLLELSKRCEPAT